MVFSYTVVEGDEDTDGIAIEANKLSVPSGHIRAGGVDAVLTHDAVAADSGHKVDGVRPTLSTSSLPTVNGAELVVTYSEALDEMSRPPSGAFTVTVGGTTRGVNRVAVDGREVTLTLASAVTTGQAVTLLYTPGSTPIRDLRATTRTGSPRRNP